MDNDESAIQGPCTLTFVVHPTVDDRVLVFRSIGEYATHWMDSRGVWVALPDADQFEKLMASLTDDHELLPLLNVEILEGTDV